MKKICSVICLLFLLNVSAGEIVSYSQLQHFTTLLPQRSDFYAIDDEVMIAEPFYVFKISSPRHPLTNVTGISDLIKTVAEISIMESYYATPQGSEIWTGVRDSLGGTLEGAKQLVTNPAESAAAMKRSVGRTGRSIKNLFKGIGKEEEKSSDGVNLEKSAGNAFTVDTARKVAYEMHLDSYTQNEYVRKLLSSIAARRSTGGLAVSATTTVATMGVPVYSMISSTATFVTNGALTPGGYVEQTEILLRDNQPAELYRTLTQHLISNNFVRSEDEPHLQAFFANPNYSPHHKAYIIAFLEKTGDLANLAHVLPTLANAENTRIADALYGQLQLLSALHNHRFTLTELLADGKENILGKTNSDEIVAILPFDYLAQPFDWHNTIAFLRGSSGAQKSVWIFGTATDEYKKWLSANGVDRVYENILHINK